MRITGDCGDFSIVLIYMIYIIFFSAAITKVKSVSVECFIQFDFGKYLLKSLMNMNNVGKTKMNMDGKESKVTIKKKVTS